MPVGAYNGGETFPV